MALGNVICTADPEDAARRDEFMLAVGPDPGNVLPPIAPAKLGPGVVDDGDLDGAVAPQAIVRTSGNAEGLWDQVVGTGWVIMSSLNAHEALDAQRLAGLDRYGVRWIHVVPSAAEPGDVIDSRGAVLPRLAAAGHVAQAVRPDAYLYGSAATAADVPAFADGLLRRLAGRGGR